MKKRISLILLYFSFWACTPKAYEQEQILKRFKGTDIESLSRAIAREDLNKVDKLVKNNPKMLAFSDSIYGYNILFVAVRLESYNSFKRLLELGADPNSKNPINHYSILIESIKPFGSQYEWRKDYRYAKLLLEYGADPNYTVDSFTTFKRTHVMGNSPLMRASRSDLDMVISLVKHGADIEKRVGGILPFTNAVSSGKFDIIYYYIDSLKLDVHQPLYIRTTDSLYIQDYIKRSMNYISDSDSDKKKKDLVKKLESMDVDFENYKYK